MQTEAERKTAGGSSFGVAKVRPAQQANRLRPLTVETFSSGEKAELDLGACGIGCDAATFGRRGIARLKANARQGTGLGTDSRQTATDPQSKVNQLTTKERACVVSFCTIG